MRRAPLILLTFAALLGGFWLLSACLEITPIIVERDASGAPADAGCVKCLEQPENCEGIIPSTRASPRSLASISAPWTTRSTAACPARRTRES
jgi:hypothetical protein